MDIQKLIQLNVEIEGLLRIIAARESDDAKQLLFSKYAEFKTIFEQENQETEAKTEAPTQSDVQPITEIVTEVEAEPQASPSQTIAEVLTPSEQAQPELSSSTVSQQYQSNDLTTAEEIAASRPNEMRVDEMLTRREARDLRKAFTLNDKFRFRRELFANNDAQFAETLNILSAMKNMEEAVEYMSDDLGWNMDSDEVKDFVNIISNHFD
jgi:hypothetical protein